LIIESYNYFEIGRWVVKPYVAVGVGGVKIAKVLALDPAGERVILYTVCAAPGHNLLDKDGGKIVFLYASLAVAGRSGERDNLLRILSLKLGAA
jgi:hypothetical protein